MTTPRSFDDIVRILGGPPGISGICGVSRNTAASWCRRRRLPIDMWPKLIGSPDGVAEGLSSDEILSAHLTSRGGGASFPPSAPQPPTIGGADPAAGTSRSASPVPAATPLAHREVTA